VAAANGGDVNGTFTFSGVGNLTGGAGDDTFKLASGGSIVGTISGGGHTTKDTLDLSAKAGAVAINLSGTGTTGVGAVSGVNDYVGNDGTAGTNTTLTGTNAGSTYTIDQANAGNVDGAITFSGVGKLTGGTGADTFKLVNDGTTTHGALSGAIDGGATAANTLDYSGTSGAVAVTLASASSGSATNTGGFTNIQSLVGNDGTTGTSTTLTGTGADSTYNVDAANGGDVNRT
jgi:hypothetical protein